MSDDRWWRDMIPVPVWALPASWLLVVAAACVGMCSESYARRVGHCEGYCARADMVRVEGGRHGCVCATVEVEDER